MRRGDFGNRPEARRRAIPAASVGEARSEDAGRPAFCGSRLRSGYQHRALHAAGTRCTPVSMRFWIHKRHETGWGIPSPEAVVPGLREALLNSAQQTPYSDPFGTVEADAQRIAAVVKIGDSLYRLPNANQWSDRDTCAVLMWVNEFRLAVWVVVERGSSLIQEVRRLYPDCSDVECLRELLPWHSDAEIAGLVGALEEVGEETACMAFGGEESFVVIGEPVVSNYSNDDLLTNGCQRLDGL